MSMPIPIHTHAHLRECWDAGTGWGWGRILKDTLNGWRCKVERFRIFGPLKKGWCDGEMEMEMGGRMRY